MPAHRLLPRILLTLAMPVALLALAFTVPARPATASLSIYADALGTGWNDWSWDPITRSLANASPHHGSSGTSIAVTYTGAWSGLKLAYPNGVAAGAYDTLRVGLAAGTGNSGRLARLYRLKIGALAP